MCRGTMFCVLTQSFRLAAERRGVRLHWTVAGGHCSHPVLYCNVLCGSWQTRYDVVNSCDVATRAWYAFKSMNILKLSWHVGHSHTYCPLWLTLSWICHFRKLCSHRRYAIESLLVCQFVLLTCSQIPSPSRRIITFAKQYDTLASLPQD